MALPVHYDRRMTTNLTVHVLTSFFLAGLWIAGATLLAERLGSRLGGLIANLPSNIVISYIFIAQASGIPYAANATAAVPVGMLIDTVFLAVLVLTLKRGVVSAVLLALASWFLLAWISASLGAYPMSVTIPVYLAITILIWLFLEYGVHLPSKDRVRTRFSWTALSVRALFAGSIVATTVLLSHFLDPYWVGLISTFPAVLLSSMVILTLAQGASFAQATGKVLILSSTNIVVYALVIRWAYPNWGIAAGTVAGFACAVVFVALIRPVLNWISS